MFSMFLSLDLEQYCEPYYDRQEYQPYILCDFSVVLTRVELTMLSFFESSKLCLLVEAKIMTLI